MPLPSDPRLYVIHSSDQHQLGLIGTGYYRDNGERRIHADLSPACRASADPCTREPVDHDLADTLQWRHVERTRAPIGTDPKMELALAAIDRMHAREPTVMDRMASGSTIPLRAEALVARGRVEELFDQLADAAAHNSLAGMSMAARAYTYTPLGQAFRSVQLFVESASNMQGSREGQRNLGLDPMGGQVAPAQLDQAREHQAPQQVSPWER